MQALVDDVARVDRLLGHEDLADDNLAPPDDRQAALQLASVTGHDALGPRPGTLTRRVAHVRPFNRDPADIDASSGWFSLHAGTRVRDHHRAEVDRRCRYVLRWPLALGRLAVDPSGNDPREQPQPTPLPCSAMSR